MDVVGMDSAMFIQFLKGQRLFMDYVLISASAVFVYDYILTLHFEIKLIWCSRWSYTKVLFLLVRYMTFANVFLLTYEQTMPDIPLATCKVTFRTSVWLILSSATLSHIILAVRTWAVWNMNRIIGVGLATLIVIDVAIRVPVIHLFINMAENAPAPYPGFKGCFFIKGARIIWMNYAVTMVVQICFFALLAISAFRSYRRNNNSELSDVIHKDGIMFYIYLLGLIILNLATTLTVPLDMVFIFSPMEEIIYSLLTARIVLTIRDAGNRRGLPLSELHTGSGASVWSPIPLWVRPAQRRIAPGEGHEDIN